MASGRVQYLEYITTENSKEIRFLAKNNSFWLVKKSLFVCVDNNEKFNREIYLVVRGTGLGYVL